MARHLIAGGAGLIGSYLARRLVAGGEDVTIVDNFSSGSKSNLVGIEGHIKLLESDLRIPLNCLRAFQMAKPDYVFQFSANMGGINWITKYGFVVMYDSALINLNMLKVYLDTGMASHYCYSSSACIYPEFLQLETDVKPLKESDAWPAQPDQFYGIEKIFTEKMCEAANRDYGREMIISHMNENSHMNEKGFDVGIRVARFHNVYGAIPTAFDKEKGKAPCHLIWKVLNCPDGGEIEIWGDGKATRSFLYIDDCVDGILKLINSDYPYPVNIGSDRLVTVDELAQIIIGISGKKIGLKHDFSKPQGVRGRNADLTLVKAVLGWQPKIRLEEGLRRTYEWAEQNRDILEV
jgi:GDP-D-mannose 3',5'-epimerase